MVTSGSTSVDCWTGPDDPGFDQDHIVGSPDWDRRTVHIEGNDCTTCYRAPDPERFLGFVGHDVNSFMPPRRTRQHGGRLRRDPGLLRRWPGRDAGM